ncbi:MAG TPA: DUF916 domain-containing protein [Ktedonobacteraceae bacterium]|nr:DUF916 domain-containing protein [Ktedonobacteraceae bacterium]
MLRLFYTPRLCALPLAILGLLFLMGLSPGVLPAPVAHAAGGANITLQPATSDPANPLTRAYFILNGKPGTALQSSVIVTNNGTATGTVNLYAVDAGTGQNSGIIYLPQDAPRNDVGAWLHLSRSQLTLAAGQSEQVAFQVVIPGKVRAGQHVGGIVAENVQQDSTTTNSKIQITVHSRRVIAVEINLPGPQIEQLSANGIQFGGSANYELLKVELSNTGTMLLKANGTLQVINSKGQMLQNLAISLDSFLPGTSIAYPVYIEKKALGVGTYQGKLLLQYGHGKSLFYTTPFTITEEQLVEVFSNNNLLAQPPATDSLLSRLSPLQLIGGAFAVLLGVSLIVLYWTKKLYLATAGAVTSGQRRKKGRMKRQKRTG